MKRHEKLASWSLGLCAVTGIFLLPSCSEEIPDIDPISMAEDVRVELGDQIFLLPRVAVRQQWRNGEYGRLNTPPFDGVEIWIGVYGTTGELTKSRQICPLLTRQWSRSICESAYTPLYKSLPRQFTLLRPQALTVYRNGGYAGIDQSMYDVVSSIDFDQERADRSCSDPDSSGHRFCSAGIGLENGLIALWFAGEDPDDDARVGRMVQSFVKNAIGPSEDFVTLEHEAVRLRDPRAPCSGDQPYEREIMERVHNYRGLTPCP
jgi:hypothetical protein